MNAIAFQAEPNPSSSDRIVFSCGDHRSAVVVGGIRNSADNRELASGTRTYLSSDRNLKRGDDDTVVDDRNLAVHQADQDNSTLLAAVGRDRSLRPARNRRSQRDYRQNLFACYVLSPSSHSVHFCPLLQ